MSAALLEEVQTDPRFTLGRPESGSGRVIIRGLAVRNFRTISDQGLSVRLSRLTTLIGPNNCGKTTLLRALELLITERVDGKGLIDDDFHNRDISKPIVIEVLLGNLPRELSQAFGASLLPDGRLLIRKEFRLTGGRVQTLFFVQGEDFENPNLQGLRTKSRIELVEIAQRIAAERARSNEERVRKISEKALQLGHRQIRTWVPLRREKAGMIQSALPVPATVSAFSTPSETERFVQTLLQRPVEAALGKLGSAQDEVKRTVAEAAGKFFSDVEEALKAQDPTILELRPRVSISLPRSVTTQFEITDTGGYTSDLHYKGAGTQRNLIIAATRIASEWEGGQTNETTSERPGLLMLIDEPEVFLHPGAQRNLFGVLERMSSRDNQVIMSTHSTVFIDTTFLHNVVLLKLSEGAVEVLQLPVKPEDPEAAARTHALIREDLGIRNSDIFFSNVVVLCEGKSDERFLTGVYRLAFGEPPEAESVHIKQIGGKDKLSPLGEMLPILRDLHIPYVIILDSDALRGGSRRIIKRLLEQGLLDQAVCRVWTRGEIEEFYTPKLLMGALAAWATERELTLEISEDELRALLETEGDKTAYKRVRNLCYERVRKVPSKDDLSRHVVECLEKSDIPAEAVSLLAWALLEGGLQTEEATDSILEEWNCSLADSLPPSVEEQLAS